MKEGHAGTLIVPYKGYSRVEFVSDCGNQTIVRICESGLEITVWTDEVDWDDPDEE